MNTVFLSIGIAGALMIFYSPLIINYYRSWEKAEADRKSYIEYTQRLFSMNLIDSKQFSSIHEEFANVSLRKHRLYREYRINPLRLYPVFRTFL